MQYFYLVFKKPDDDKISEHLKQWVSKLPGECSLRVGKVVDRLDDIQVSFQSCEEQAKGKAGDEEKQKKSMIQEQSKDDAQKKMKEDILRYLGENFRDVNLSQAQVADIFRISNYTLSRLFKNQVGIGFSEYVVAKRLECAKELLITTSYTVNEISNMAGFNSASYFCKIFKTYEGVSPAVFRETH